MKTSCVFCFASRLVSLEELDCSFNEVEALPSSIGQFSQIRTFAADHNFLIHLPPEVQCFFCSYYVCHSLNQIQNEKMARQSIFNWLKRSLVVGINSLYRLPQHST